MTTQRETTRQTAATILAADTGGTFTDLAAYDRNGPIAYSKSLTTYDDLVRGVMDLRAQGAHRPRRGRLIKFGTTLIINTLVERTGAKTALVTTEGFRDVSKSAAATGPYLRPVLSPRSGR